MLDEVQALMRRDKIGASEAAATCGVHPWITAYDLWALKTGRVTAFQGNRYTEAGNYFEPSIGKWLQDQIGAPMATDICLLHSDGIRIANLDGAFPDGPEPGLSEIKTAGLFSGRVASDAEDPKAWQEPDDNPEGIPRHVYLQVHQQFACAEEDPRFRDIDLCHVAVFIGGRGFRRYRIRKNKKVMGLLADSVHAFWDNHVKADVAPDGACGPELGSRILREEGLAVDVSAEAVEKWLDLREQRLQAEEAEEQAKASVIGLLTNAEVGRLPDGRSVTYYLQKRKEYVSKATEFRVLRIKK
jgi:putative phage-type endonuclease